MRGLLAQIIQVDYLHRFQLILQEMSKLSIKAFIDEFRRRMRKRADQLGIGLREGEAVITDASVAPGARVRARLLAADAEGRVTGGPGTPASGNQAGAAGQAISQGFSR